jgi:restriction system protein
MPVPDFQALMLPILELAADGREKKLSRAVELMADKFNLSQEERDERLPRGRQTRIYNNVSWAITYLRAARILESPSRGTFRITERGRQVLAENPQAIDVRYLRRFEEFVQFASIRRERGNGQAQAESDIITATTPDEELEAAYKALRQALAQELLERVKNCSPSFFEELVVDLLVAMGYGGSIEDAGQALGKSDDEGVNGVIKSDILGFDQIYVQAKRWTDTVGKPIVQAFAGSLDGLHSKQGVLITTSEFSQEAHEYVERIDNKKIILIDGERLVQLMIDYNIGVTEKSRYVIKRVDNDYFEDAKS